MKYYWVKTHWLVKRLFPHYIWDKKSADKTVYLTFDDGPTPEVTDWVLDQLRKYDARATFFCIGNNVVDNQSLFEQVIADGHDIGNHTFNHVNGWRIPDSDYLKDTEDCESAIAGHNPKRLFRPPYGKLRRLQSRELRKKGYNIVMWDILSADFDQNVSPEKCLENVLKNIVPGSIIIFHDSVKASKNLNHALPGTLEFLEKNGYKCGLF